MHVVFSKTKRKSQSNRSNNIQWIFSHCPCTSLLKCLRKTKPNLRYRLNYRIKMYSCVKETTIDSEIKNTIVCDVLKCPLCQQKQCKQTRLSFCLNDYYGLGSPWKHKKKLQDHITILVLFRSFLMANNHKTGTNWKIHFILSGVCRWALRYVVSFRPYYRYFIIAPVSLSLCSCEIFHVNISQILFYTLKLLLPIYYDVNATKTITNERHTLYVYI